MLYAAAVFGKPLNSICLVPAYEDHCRQIILSSFQNKGDFVGAVNVKTSCHIMLYILRSIIFQPYICKNILFVIVMKQLNIYLAKDSMILT